MMYLNPFMDQRSASSQERVWKGRERIMCIGAWKMLEGREKAWIRIYTVHIKDLLWIWLMQPTSFTMAKIGGAKLGDHVPMVAAESQVELALHKWNDFSVKRRLAANDICLSNYLNLQQQCLLYGTNWKNNQARPTLIIQPTLCDMNLLKNVNSGKEMFLRQSKSQLTCMSYFTCSTRSVCCCSLHCSVYLHQVKQIRKQRHGNIRLILALLFGLLLQRAKENTLSVVDIYYYLVK